jgi:hypothetical protein
MSSILHGDGSFRFTAEVVGDDLKVSNVVSTWFGGPDDPSDNGLTASGVSTRDNPGLLGCALPMNGFHNARTDGSPIPRLPWQTPVRVKNLQTCKERTFLLIDLGPSKFAPSHAAIDLTKAAFAALGGDPAAGVMRVDYTVPGGAHFLATGSGVSLAQSEAANPPAGPAAPSANGGHGDDHDVPKPPVKFIQSPNHSSRNGTAIDMIVLHYTDGPTAQSAINRFLDPASQVSAHYIVDRNGDIYQMVRDSDKAWHALAANSRSIGIEHVAMPGQGMATAQEQSSVALIKWLIASYSVTKDNITGHRYAPGNAGHTDCPDGLFGANTKKAVTDWVTAHFS